MSITQNTILIVDDMPANLGVLFNQLDRSGFRVLLAQDGNSAVRQAHDDQPDIILLDVLMPVLDGFDTCRQLKENEATRHIPVIFMTALTDIESKVKAFEAGGVDYVTKPIEWQEVLARVITHLTLRNLQRSLEEEIAERKQAQAKLAQERNLLRTLIDNIPDNIYVKDVEGRFMLNNLAHGRAMGGVEVEGKTEYELFPEAPAQQRERRDHELIKNGQPLVSYEEFERNDDSYRWLLTTKVPLRNSHGQIIGLISISRDISERKRKEDMLRSHAARLQILHEIDRDILAGQSPKIVAQTVLSYLRDAIPCRRASIVTFERQAGAKEINVARVLAAQVDFETNLGVDALLPIEAFSLESLKKGRVTKDILAHHDRSETEQALLAEGVSAYMNVPLIAGNELIGALNLGASSPEAFTDSATAIAEEVAVHMSIAIRYAASTDD
ncbi:MAG TPA: response regulator [Anaerolineae bacterium]|nr:response regulator [Anaerolineae bacterium]HMR63361.1 response regulator [Anaerolineae bacterium]